LGVSFTTFAWLTTQNHAIRAGSPWQDDPYDAVVSFTEFLVPTLIVLIGARALLWRPHQPQPLFRVAQMLRAARVCSLLVAGTVATDGVAAALHADHQYRKANTPWLIASLALIAALTAASLATHHRAVRLLPDHHTQPGTGSTTRTPASRP
jgi:hypothetical protein